MGRSHGHFIHTDLERGLEFFFFISLRFDWKFLSFFVIDTPHCEEHGNVTFEKIRLV